jgi:hypothetical protein
VHQEAPGCETSAVVMGAVQHRVTECQQRQHDVVFSGSSA